MKRFLVSGAIAGCIGTLPMTLFMLLAQRFLPKGQQYALPPEIITKQALDLFHVKRRANKTLILSATTLSHFGYGAIMGALYAVITKGKGSLAPLKGGAFGLLIWAGSYLILLPSLRIKASGQREPGQRNFMMIVAHLIWGLTTAIVAKVIGKTGFFGLS